MSACDGVAAEGPRAWRRRPCGRSHAGSSCGPP